MYCKDSGIGIPKSSQERIFQKFFRAENAILTQPEGTGLGLYIAKAMAKLMGGTITFTSQENKGTTFIVRLPLEHRA